MNPRIHGPWLHLQILGILSQRGAPLNQMLNNVSSWQVTWPLEMIGAP
jgi:hypothetical protein